MLTETTATSAPAPPPFEAEELPFPFNQRPFCRYEPIEKRIQAIRVLIIDDLLRDESDLSDVAYREWGAQVATELRRERFIAGLAMENIRRNIERLVREPEIEIAHLSDASQAVARFQPQAIVLSGTLRDFDFYQPEMIARFATFIRETKIPVLAICGGHQLVGQCFGAQIVTLDNQEPHTKRTGRVNEYQYRFIRITNPADPIFKGIADENSGVWQDYTKEENILRVWQNHGLQLDRVPEGFELLGTAYLCKNQMMVKRAGGQLIYAVQFHLEKSFEDWNKNHTRWEHPNESRDGRILFENFLELALAHPASVS
jgi:GMP synthase-like glutamine amidotransferase